MSKLIGIFKYRAVSITGCLVLSLIVLASSAAVLAQAAPKVTICHRTNSVTNPYVQQEVAAASVNGNAGDDNGQGDHYLEHTGPVASSETIAQALKDAKIDWGDIIPPIPGVHAGLNWSAAGQAIYNNGCNYAVVPPLVITEEPIVPTNPVLAAAAPNPTMPTPARPQVVTPAGGVKAGAGGAAPAVAASVLGLGGSLASLGYGILRFRKRA